jgi:hypothetical protein
MVSRLDTQLKARKSMGKMLMWMKKAVLRLFIIFVYERLFMTHATFTIGTKLVYIGRWC